jgi:hypothetical protein
VSEGASGRAFEFNAPEVRRGRKKFDANALAAIAGLTQKNDTTFQFFLRSRVLQNQHFAIFYFVFEQQKAAVRVDHDGFASLAELLAVVILSGRLYRHAAEDAGAAARGGECGFDHDSIFKLGEQFVN